MYIYIHVKHIIIICIQIYIYYCYIQTIINTRLYILILIEYIMQSYIFIYIYIYYIYYLPISGVFVTNHDQYWKTTEIIKFANIYIIFSYNLLITLSMLNYKSYTINSNYRFSCMVLNSFMYITTHCYMKIIWIQPVNFFITFTTKLKY